MDAANDRLPLTSGEKTDAPPSWEWFAPVYERYYRRIYNYCFYRTGNHHAAEDVTGDIFERVILKYHGFDEDKSPFEAWLFMLARNSVADYYRQGRREAIVPLDDMLPDGGKPPDEAAAEEETSLLLARAVASLREKERHAVALKYGARLKNTEIARVLGVSEANAGVMLHRALKRLRKYLTDRGVETGE